MDDKAILVAREALKQKQQQLDIERAALPLTSWELEKHSQKECQILMRFAAVFWLLFCIGITLARIVHGISFSEPADVCFIGVPSCDPSHVKNAIVSGVLGGLVSVYLWMLSSACIRVKAT